MSSPEYKVKLHNIRQKRNYPNPLPATENTKKSYKTNLSLVKEVAPQVKDKVTINPQSRYKQFLKETMPHTKLEMEFRTKGKQKMLSGGKAGGMSYIFKAQTYERNTRNL
jgi:hypothetical protein